MSLRFLKMIISIPLAMIVIINLLFFLSQPRMVFFPISEVVANPDMWGMKYETVNITTQDNVKLAAWYIPNNDSEMTILFFHGNAGNISHRRDTLTMLHELGVNILIVDYRGFGQSEGKITEKGLYLDAKACWQYLTDTRKIDSSKIIIFGRSLGGAIATQLASEVDAAGLVLESTFSSIRDMAMVVLPIISYIVYLRYDFNSAKKIKSVKIPKLFIHSQEDEMIPYRLGNKLYLAAAQPKRMFSISGGHNDGFIINKEKYLAEIRDFMSGLN